MQGAPAGQIDPVDRAFALAATPRPRRTRFPATTGCMIGQELDRLAGGVILPRRLAIGADDGAQLVLLLRRRQVVGVVSAQPDDLWTHPAGLPMRPDDETDDGSGPTLAEAAAEAISRLIGRAGDLELRLDFADDGDDTGSDGVSMDELLEALEPLLAKADLAPDRATILETFFDRMDDYPRLLIAPDRREILPEDTPDDIRRLFGDIGPGNIRHGPGDPPDIVVFEQGKSGAEMTVKIADETRLCLVHAQTRKRAEALMAATWQLKTALELAAAAGTDPQAPPQ